VTARDVLILITALTGTVLATPVMRWLALRVGVVDQPSARKVHRKPIPLLGGVAISKSTGNWGRPASCSWRGSGSTFSDGKL
jgi:UDP-N-acetylmuramyl pentapeptide phosphotransferase/UDP-N-acetylglucosamine-1-phosphate transferase